MGKDTLLTSNINKEYDIKSFTVGRKRHKTKNSCSVACVYMFVMTDVKYSKRIHNYIFFVNIGKIQVGKAPLTIAMIREVVPVKNICF